MFLLRSGENSESQIYHQILLLNNYSAPSKGSDQAAHLQSDQNLHRVHFGQSRMQIFFMQKMKTLNRWMDAQADLSLRWALMSEGTFSHVVIRIVTP